MIKLIMADGPVVTETVMTPGGRRSLTVVRYWPSGVIFTDIDDAKDCGFLSVDTRDKEGDK